MIFLCLNNAGKFINFLCTSNLYYIDRIVYIPLGLQDICSYSMC